MKREINPRLSYKRSIVQILSELSKAVEIQKKFFDMTRDDILYYRALRDIRQLTRTKQQQVFKQLK